MRQLLSNRTFVRLFAGRLVTNAGDSLAAVATMWLIHELGGSPALTGIAGALTLAPSTIQFVFGPLVDRLPLRRVLLSTQIAQLVVVLTVPVAWSLGVLSVWLVMAIGPLTALLNQPVYPAQSAALPRIVEAEDLTDANSAFAFALQGSDSVLNAIAGVIIAAVGGIAIFVVDAVTFAIAALLFARLTLDGTVADADPDGTAATAVSTDGGADEQTDDSALDTDGAEGTDEGSLTASVSSYWSDLIEGFSFVRGTVLLHLAFIPTIVNFHGGMSLALMPAFADTLGGATAYGTLLAVMAGGGLVGSLIASPVDGVRYGLLAPTALAISGLALLCAILVPGLVPTAVLFCVGVLPIGVLNVLSSALIQSAVPEGMVGRVTALMVSTSSMAAPLGAVIGGSLAGVFGVIPVFAAGSLTFFLAALHHLIVPSVRKLPPVAETPRITKE
ncbi:MFS transporter [Haloarchaeobius amylolyticus]|uniref:MFS transporter n=1 Tax=Haloarchaeobius amylolyticus TaxID=1198296 RepID=UPI002271CF89|nr:MFS transporter [Haloarchaeobius amylolyticus]